MPGPLVELNLQIEVYHRKKDKKYSLALRKKIYRWSFFLTSFKPNIALYRVKSILMVDFRNNFVKSQDGIDKIVLKKLFLITEAKRLSEARI